MISISGQDPGRLLDIHDEDKIELFDGVWVIEEVVCCQIQISDHLVAVDVVGRSQAYGGQILGFDENDPAVI